jgi:hypothetical protein
MAAFSGFYESHWVMCVVYYRSTAMAI